MNVLMSIFCSFFFWDVEGVPISSCEEETRGERGREEEQKKKIGKREKRNLKKRRFYLNTHLCELRVHPPALYRVKRE